MKISNRDLSIDHLWPDYILKWNWIVPQGRIMTVGNSMFFYPYDLVSYVQRTYGSENALDVLKPILHERIDQIFNKK